MMTRTREIWSFTFLILVLVLMSETLSAASVDRQQAARQAGDEVPLYYTPAYLLNDATTGIPETSPNLTEGEEQAPPSLEGLGEVLGEAAYNLSGQRLVQSQKGLFIYKGKKYINK